MPGTAYVLAHARSAQQGEYQRHWEGEPTINRRITDDHSETKAWDDVILHHD